MATAQAKAGKLSQHVTITTIARGNFIPKDQEVPYQHPNDFATVDAEVQVTGYAALDTGDQLAFDAELIDLKGKFRGRVRQQLADKYGLTATDINDRVSELKSEGRIEYQYQYGDGALRSQRRKINEALSGTDTLAQISEQFDLRWTLKSVKDALRSNRQNPKLLAKLAELTGQ